MSEFQEVPTVKTGMLIRQPVERVFDAFVDPAQTTQFWFTKSSGRLEAGKRVRWDWEMYGVFADVDVKALEPNRRIIIEWPMARGTGLVEWKFTPRAEGTFVEIQCDGFQGTADEILHEVSDIPADSHSSLPARRVISSME